MYKSIALAAFMASTILAAPTAKHTRQTTGDSGTFVVIATNTGNSAVDLQQINANNFGFYVGRPTVSYCPNNIADLDCPPGNVTAFSSSGAASQGYLGLDTIVPGGQGVFVSADGSLNYTEAHSGYVPPTALRASFTYKADYGPHTGGSLSFSPGGGFAACPVGDGSFAIKVKLDELVLAADCLNMGAFTLNQTGYAAWQYE